MSKARTYSAYLSSPWYVSLHAFCIDVHSNALPNFMRNRFFLQHIISKNAFPRAFGSYWLLMFVL
ncbi:hypothetical protein CW304_08390 [Bacillus sp. UFRGS-B20]|nr:hypothetical protein CW304_08390 [Bacillus sp. UFRGS-B20]